MRALRALFDRGPLESKTDVRELIRRDGHFSQAATRSGFVTMPERFSSKPIYSGRRAELVPDELAALISTASRACFSSARSELEPWQFSSKRE